MVNFFETSCLLLYPRNAVFSLTSKSSTNAAESHGKHRQKQVWSSHVNPSRLLQLWKKLCMAKHSNAMAVRNQKTMGQMHILALLLKELERERWQLALETQDRLEWCHVWNLFETEKDMGSAWVENCNIILQHPHLNPCPVRQLMKVFAFPLTADCLGAIGLFRFFLAAFSHCPSSLMLLSKQRWHDRLSIANDFCAECLLNI